MVVTIEGNASRACLNVTVFSDGVYESEETFVLRINTTDEDTMILNSFVVITIVDEDSKSCESWVSTCD